MLNIFLLIITLFSSFQERQQKYTLIVENLQNNSSPIRVAIYRDKEHFLEENHVFKEIAYFPKGSKIAHIDEYLTPGQYAVALFQDINNNGRLDKNFLGMPKEPYGFSNNYKVIFSAPHFNDCAININEKNTIFKIQLTE